MFGTTVSYIQNSAFAVPNLRPCVLESEVDGTKRLKGGGKASGASKHKCSVWDWAGGMNGTIVFVADRLKGRALMKQSREALKAGDNGWLEAKEPPRLKGGNEIRFVFRHRFRSTVRPRSVRNRVSANNREEFADS